jgi:hypothetical protein
MICIYFRQYHKIGDIYLQINIKLYQDIRFKINEST